MESRFNSLFILLFWNNLWNILNVVLIENSFSPPCPTVTNVHENQPTRPKGTFPISRFYGLLVPDTRLWMWFLNRIPAVEKEKRLCISRLTALIAQTEKWKYWFSCGYFSGFVMIDDALGWFTIHPIFFSVQLANPLLFFANTACWCFCFPGFDTLSQQASSITVTLSLWYIDCS